MEKLENMIGKTYYRPLPKIDGENKIFIVQEVSLVKKRNTYYWGGEQCHPSWLIEDALVYFETKEECQDACYRYEYEAKYVDINSDNIHLYYQFMNNEDLEKYAVVIDDILQERLLFISQELNISSDILIENSSIQTIEFQGDDMYLKISIFDVLDVLKQINKYIEDIKNSNEYKSFISKAS